MHGQVKRYLIMTIGCMISCSAINIFLVPNHLLSGGASGIAMIFYYLFGLPIGMQTLLMNVPLLIAAYQLMGRHYTINVVFCAVIFSMFVDLFSFCRNIKWCRIHFLPRFMAVCLRGSAMELCFALMAVRRGLILSPRL